MRNRLFSIIFCLVITLCVQAQVIHTQILEPNVKTLRVRYAPENPDERQITAQRPFLVLGEDQQLEISFDELSHSVHYYTYTLLHLNSDWTISNLSSIEYLSGFSTGEIVDYQSSMLTQQDYTHYSFLFPNEDMHITQSGNYALKIYEDGNIDKPIAYACFSVVEPKVEIVANVHANTSIEFNGRFQQLDIDLNLTGICLQSPEDIRLVVQQNGRWDNAVYNPRPTYIETKRLRFVNHRALIFEGGQEYRHFDLSSVYILGRNVEQIHFDKSHQRYEALLDIDENWAKAPYLSERDANGQWLINAERTDEDDSEAEYILVWFSLSQESPFFDGRLFLGGDLTYNQVLSTNELKYDDELKLYIIPLYLKQGGYDYQYWFKEKRSPSACKEANIPSSLTPSACTTQRTEGSHWETQNEYTIYVYYRPFGARADQLIGIQRL